MKKHIATSREKRGKHIHIEDEWAIYHWAAPCSLRLFPRERMQNNWEDGVGGEGGGTDGDPCTQLLLYVRVPPTSYYAREGEGTGVFCTFLFDIVLLSFFVYVTTTTSQTVYFGFLVDNKTYSIYAGNRRRIRKKWEKKVTDLWERNGLFSITALPPHGRKPTAKASRSCGYRLSWVRGYRTSRSRGSCVIQRGRLSPSRYQFSPCPASEGQRSSLQPGLVWSRLKFTPVFVL
jgi:hypothetical protein